MNVLLVFIGGGLGSVLRYLTNVFVRSQAGNDFPFGILAINIIGSFLIGLIYALVKKFGIAEPVATFIMVGLLGGFTTFSAFSLDVVTMINDGKTPAALIYIAASVILSIFAAFIGMGLTKLI